ncbi:hypothetical protein [Thermoanaerobacterium thermosaccharolyticum]|uniref:hypothetical protein n=1 Tax=Thermoanaerobacterium thermosaccharolyticum TaxID=1517 RepID=UPI002FD9DE3D
MDSLEQRVLELEQRVLELESQNRLLTDALLRIASEKGEPLAKNFSTYALLNKYTAYEIQELEGLLKWAFNKSTENNLSKEEFIEEFNRRLPKRKNELNFLFECYRRENILPYLCDLVLGDN